MRKSSCLGIFISLSLSTATFFLPRAAASSSYVNGQIVQIEKSVQSSPPYAGVDSPTDSPLRSSFYAFDISVRVNGATYRTRYESILGFLPSSFAAGENLPVRMAKRGLFFYAPDGEEMKLRRVRHEKQWPDSRPATREN